MGNAESLARALQRGSFLVIRCYARVDGERCGHEARWPAEIVLKLFPPGAHRYQVARKLQCSSCDTVGQVELGVM